MHSDDEHAEVDAMRRAHREASDRIEDRPDASVRAAVLAAAARGVDARPHLASTATPPPKTTPHAPLQSRRWPLSAAALLVVSVLTGLIATQVMRDSPERITTVASSPVPPQTLKAEAPVAESGPKEAAASPPPSRVPARGERPSSVVASPRPETVDRAPRTHDVERSKAAVPVAPARQDDPRTEPSMAQARMQPAAAAPVRAEAPDAATPPQRAEAEALFRATTAQNATRARIGRAAEPVTPEAWVERIVKMRADGNDVEADRELDALRQRYPGFEIPSGALGKR